MNCMYFRDQMRLCFGDRELPEDVAEHVRQCPACHAFREELKALATSLPDDMAFYPDSGDADILTNRVEQIIDSTAGSPIRSVSRFSWLIPEVDWTRALSAAAAIVLFVGVGIVSYMYGLSDSVKQATEKINEGESTSVVLAEIESGEPDQATIKALMYDFTSSQFTEADERLLDDITEEEYEHLKNNFDVGDIL